MATANPNLPARLRGIRGKLEVINSLHGEFVVRCATTHLCYRLNTGDKVTIGGTPVTVNSTYMGKHKLNGNIGHLATIPGEDEWGYARHIFFWHLPVEANALQPWLDAYVNRDEVAVTFAARPLRDRSDTFIAGKLEPFHEQGMEGNIGWSVSDTQKRSYDALHMLNTGDKLTIFNAAGTRVIWSGTLTERRMTALRESCYDRRKKPTKEIQFLIRSFFQHLPAVVETKKK